MAGRSASSHGVSRTPSPRSSGDTAGRSMPVAVIGRPPGRAGARRRSRRPAGTEPSWVPSSANPALVATRHDAVFARACCSCTRCRPSSSTAYVAASASARGATPRPRAAGSVQYDAVAHRSIRLISRNATAPTTAPSSSTAQEAARPSAQRSDRPAIQPRAAARSRSGGRGLHRAACRVGQPGQHDAGVVVGPRPQPQAVAGQGDRVERLRCGSGRTRRVGRQPGMPVHVVQDAVTVVERLPLDPLEGEPAAGCDRAGRPVADGVDERDPVQPELLDAVPARTVATASRATPRRRKRGARRTRSRRCRGSRRSGAGRPGPSGSRVSGSRTAQSMRSGSLHPALHPGPCVVRRCAGRASTRTRSGSRRRPSPGPRRRRRPPRASGAGRRRATSGTCRGPGLTCSSPASSPPTQPSSRSPRCRSRCRQVPSMVKPSFSATRREAVVADGGPPLDPLQARAPRSPNWQTSRVAAVITPWPRAHGAVQKPISRIVASRACRPTMPSSRPSSAIGTTTRSAPGARRPASGPAARRRTAGRAPRCRAPGPGSSGAISGSWQASAMAGTSTSSGRAEQQEPAGSGSVRSTGFTRAIQPGTRRTRSSRYAG